MPNITPLALCRRGARVRGHTFCSHPKSPFGSGGIGRPIVKKPWWTWVDLLAAFGGEFITASRHSASASGGRFWRLWRPTPTLAGWARRSTFSPWACSPAKSATSTSPSRTAGGPGNGRLRGGRWNRGHGDRLPRPAPGHGSLRPWPDGGQAHPGDNLRRLRRGGDQVFSISLTDPTGGLGLGTDQAQGVIVEPVSTARQLGGVARACMGRRRLLVIFLMRDREHPAARAW